MSSLLWTVHYEGTAEIQPLTFDIDTDAELDGREVILPGAQLEFTLVNQVKTDINYY